MSPQEKAEVFFIIIKRLFKWFMWAILIFIVCTLLLFGYIRVSEYYKFGRHEERVAVEIAIDKRLCPEREFPLSITVLNKSKRVVKSVNVSVTVTKAGYSTALNNLDTYTIDKILKPGESTGYCYQVLSREYDRKTFRPALLIEDGLAAALSYKSITFQ